MKAWPIATAAVATAVIAGTALGSAVTPVPTVPELPRARMGVVLNSLVNSFFVAIYQGVRAGAAQLELDVPVRSVTSNTAVDDQAAQVRALVAQHKRCYVINPITGTNLLDPLRGVDAPIITVDSPVDLAAAERAGVRIRTHIGTDDQAAGKLAGTRMASILNGRGDVGLIGGVPGNVNSGLRLDGFESGIRDSEIEIVARVNADYDRTKAEIAAERILRAHPRLAGFFAASDAMALGVADAVTAAGRTGAVKIVGLDGLAETLDAIRTGSINATVSQYPYVMGQMAVEACAAAATGAQLPARVDAPIALLTKENVSRAIAAFPKPFQRYPDPFRALLRGRG
jgi:ABC-type sugar transport system substrate-binding protein